MTGNPFALNEDGSAKDPDAFQQGIKNDPDKLAALQNEPDTLQTVLGSDLDALQTLLRTTYKVRSVFHGLATPAGTQTPRCQRSDTNVLQLQALKSKRQKAPSERTIDAQRVDATIPR